MRSPFVENRLFVALAVTVALGGAPSVAAACACCDGFTNLKVDGWSRSGKSVLISLDGVVACEAFKEQRVLRLGKMTATRCFDLLTSTRPVPCDARQTHAFPIKGKAKRSTLGPMFPQKATALPDQRVRTRNGWDKKKGRWQTRVELRVGKRWRRLWRGALPPYAPDDPSGRTRPDALSVEATIHPAPSGTWALLVLRNYESMPGIGHRTESAHWVRLPVR